MESELGNDAVYGPFGDTEVTLSEFLSNDLRASFRIQESVTDHLTDEFLGAPVVPFGASFGAEESLAAFFEEKSPELEVTLPAITEFGGGMVDAFGPAFAINEHGDFTGDFVVFGDGKRAECALDALTEEFEGNHRDLLGERQNSLIKYGTLYHWTATGKASVLA